MEYRLMKKEKIVHIIDNLERGGAETMLVSLLKEMTKSYDIILVTLSDQCDFDLDEIYCTEKYCLDYKTIKDLPNAVFKLRKIIKKYSPILVRTQLYWSTIVGRLATPKRIPFIFSIHNKLSIDAFGANKLSYYLEKLTYRKRHTLISVSEDSLTDYCNYIFVNGKSVILNNFVNDKFFNQSYDYKQRDLDKIKIVAVGNLRHQKNYEFLLEVVKSIKGKADIELDIVGDGNLRETLQATINQFNLPVRLLGKQSDVEKLLPNYDAFIMCSHYEGFGNAPVEAMAVGLPLILNDLDIMKEMSKGNALFYASKNLTSLSNLLLNLSNNKSELNRLSEEGKKIARENYSLGKYFLKLKTIYNDVRKNNSDI